MTLSYSVYIHVILNIKIKADHPSVPGWSGQAPISSRDRLLLVEFPATRPRGSHPAPGISPWPGRYRRRRQPSDTQAVSQGPASPLLLNKMHVYKHKMPWRLAVQRRGA